MEGARPSCRRHCAEFRCGWHARSDQRLVQRVLQRFAGLRVRAFLAARRQVCIPSLRAYRRRRLRYLSAADAADQMAHMAHGSLPRTLDGESRLLQARNACRGYGQSRPAHIRGHRAVRRADAHALRGILEAADDARGVCRRLVESVGNFDRSHRQLGVPHLRLHAVVLAHLLRLGHGRRAPRRQEAHRAELREAALRSGLPLQHDARARKQRERRLLRRRDAGGARLFRALRARHRQLP